MYLGCLGDPAPLPDVLLVPSQPINSWRIHLIKVSGQGHDHDRIDANKGRGLGHVCCARVRLWLVVSKAEVSAMTKAMAEASSTHGPVRNSFLFTFYFVVNGEEEQVM